MSTRDNFLKINLKEKEDYLFEEEIYKGLFKDGKIEGSGVCESQGEKISCADF